MPKKITKRQHTGRTGEVFVGYLFEKLGLKWHESKTDAGIDCHVEWRNSETGEVTNRHIGVQVKSSSGAFSAETSTKFEQLCSQDDIEYWMQGTMPVLLVCCKPWANEAYWIDIKKYFTDPDHRRSGKAVFVKSETRLDENALPHLQSIALPAALGLYLGAPPKREQLYSNLVSVTRLPERIFIAETDLRKRKQVFATLREKGIEHVPGEFITRGQEIISVHDLRTEPWNFVARLGTSESQGFEDWWRGDAGIRRGHLVELLNHCLTALLYTKSVRWRASEKVYFFKPHRGQNSMTVRTHGLRRESTTHTVFKIYRKLNSDGIRFCRHHALRAQFRDINERWYLEITPTYFFTRDGWTEDKYGSQRLKKIKEYEGNQGVFGNALMWANFLSDTSEDIWHRSYPHLAFAGMTTFDVTSGIPDDAWKPQAPEKPSIDPLLFEI